MAAKHQKINFIIFAKNSFAGTNMTFERAPDFEHNLKTL